MIVYESRLLKKSSNCSEKLKLVLSRLVTTWLSNITFHLLLIWLQTLVVIDSESHLTAPDVCCHLKLLCCSIWTWADSLSSDRLGCLFRSAASQRIQFRTCYFCSYVILLLNNWSKDGLKQWALLWWCLVSINFSPIPLKISFHMKKKGAFVVAQKFTNLFDSWTESVSQDW